MISGTGSGGSASGLSATANASSSNFISSPISNTFRLQLRRSVMQQQYSTITNGILETSVTPKSHSSTQLYDYSLDVESGMNTSIDYLDPTGLLKFCTKKKYFLYLGIHPRAKSMGETFLVCVHNVSDNHLYAILRTSIDNTAKDVIKQVFFYYNLVYI